MWAHDVVLQRIFLIPAAEQARKYGVFLHSMRSHPSLEPRLKNFGHNMSSSFPQRFESKVHLEQASSIDIKKTATHFMTSDTNCIEPGGVYAREKNSEYNKIYCFIEGNAFQGCRLLWVAEERRKKIVRT